MMRCEPGAEMLAANSYPIRWYFGRYGWGFTDSVVLATQPVALFLRLDYIALTLQLRKRDVNSSNRINSLDQYSGIRKRGIQTKSDAGSMVKRHMGRRMNYWLYLKFRTTSAQTDFSRNAFQRFDGDGTEAQVQITVAVFAAGLEMVRPGTDNATGVSQPINFSRFDPVHGQ